MDFDPYLHNNVLRRALQRLEPPTPPEVRLSYTNARLLFFLSFCHFQMT